MKAVLFDTLKLAVQLQAGGFTAEQASASSSMLAQAFDGADLMTKAELKTELRDIESRLKLSLGLTLLSVTGLLAIAIGYTATR